MTNAQKTLPMSDSQDLAAPLVKAAPEKGEPERAECDFGPQKKVQCRQHGSVFVSGCAFCDPQ